MTAFFVLGLVVLGLQDLFAQSSGRRLFVDGSSNESGSGIGIVLVTPENAKIEKAVKLGLEA